MAKNKRKTAPIHNIHSYFGKKGRADQGSGVDDDSEQINLVASTDLEQQEPEGLDGEIPIAPPTPQAPPNPPAPPTPGASPTPPVQQENDEFAVLIVQRDPGLRCQIRDYPPNVQEKARLAYMKHGPYQFHMDEYPLDGHIH